MLLICTSSSRWLSEGFFIFSNACFFPPSWAARSLSARIFYSFGFSPVFRERARTQSTLAISCLPSSYLCEAQIPKPGAFCCLFTLRVSVIFAFSGVVHLLLRTQRHIQLVAGSLDARNSQIIRQHLCSIFFHSSVSVLPSPGPLEQDEALQIDSSRESTF